MLTSALSAPTATAARLLRYIPCDASVALEPMSAGESQHISSTRTKPPDALAGNGSDTFAPAVVPQPRRALQPIYFLDKSN